MSSSTFETGRARFPTVRALRRAGTVLRAAVAPVVGALLGVLTVGFTYILVFGYFVLTPEEAERASVARELATGWAPALFFTLGVWLAAFVIGTRAGRWALGLGLLVGISAVATEQATILLRHPPVSSGEFALFAGLGTVAGLLGGWFSQLERSRTEASERVLFDATVSVARAGDPDGVARALASLLGPERVACVGVWRGTPRDGRGIAGPSGTWGAGSPGTLPVTALLAAAGPRALGCGRGANLMSETLSSDARRVWAEAGVRSAFAGPLICLGGESLGFLFVGFRRTTLVTGAGRRRVLSAAAAAGLALEKLAGLERQRKQDRKLGVMEERERLSREIHDSLIQYLGSIAGELDAAEMAAGSGVEERVPHHLRRAREAARRATGETRRVMRALRPELLEHSSLAEALAVLTQRNLEAYGIRATLRVAGEARPLAPEMEHDLTRIAQEALSNAGKHSGASLVQVTLSFGPEHVELEVADNGAGIRAAGSGRSDGGHETGFGMQSMRERADRIAGRLEVETSEESGTRIFVTAPVRDGGL